MDVSARCRVFRTDAPALHPLPPPRHAPAPFHRHLEGRNAEARAADALDPLPFHLHLQRLNREARRADPRWLPRLIDVLA